jgi:uncharacterized membrane protein YphA (DoxX/SURF4 family)
MKIIKEISRILLGITFVFSGFVKGIDPLGSTYKFTDYFNAFGTDWANSLAFILAIVLSVLEFGIGIGLLFNYRIRIFSWLTLIFMGFFLPFSLFIAITNPVTDCGCFGDAWVLTNWETFTKNVIFSILAVIVFIKRHNFKNNYNINFQNAYFVFFILLFGYAQHRSYHHLPLIDFRPYKIGNNIVEEMTIPDDAPRDEYKTEFIYRNKNNGEEKKFDETNYPWQDTENWEYVDSKSILLKKGYEPPIKDFTIENEYGEDVSDFFLYDPGYTFILVSYSLEKANKRKQNKINELAINAIASGMNFICLTSSPRPIIEQFIEEHNPPYEFFFCDEIALKTIVRSNPGLVLTKEANILNKWHWRDIPKFEKVKF